MATTFSTGHPLDENQIPPTTLYNSNARRITSMPSTPELAGEVHDTRYAFLQQVLYGLPLSKVAADLGGTLVQSTVQLPATEGYSTIDNRHDPYSFAYSIDANPLCISNAIEAPEINHDTFNDYNLASPTQDIHDFGSSVDTNQPWIPTLTTPQVLLPPTLDDWDNINNLNDFSIASPLQNANNFVDNAGASRPWMMTDGLVPQIAPWYSNESGDLDNFNGLTLASTQQDTSNLVYNTSVYQPYIPVPEVAPSQLVTDVTNLGTFNSCTVGSLPLNFHNVAPNTNAYLPSMPTRNEPQANLMPAVPLQHVLAAPSSAPVIPPHPTTSEHHRCPKGCTETFRRAGDYRRHMLKHDSPRFKCVVIDCSRTFYRADKLRSHIKQGHKLTL
ncbi:hypothetical protein GQ44DRAFT_826399 [Phaeosphaeriaceae sp. PMI808]|nr:hypothetical protein GQ44DRAFT_826399 [Phaeosphaeriaceae sp. PMI808]